jgi:hypothetical protein
MSSFDTFTVTPESKPTMPRICMPSFRKLSRMPFHCGRYEAQDILADVDAVDLVDLQPASSFELKSRWQRRLLYRDVT